MIYIEHDDTRDVGVVMTIPLFFPFIYLLVWKKTAALVTLPDTILYFCILAVAVFPALSVVLVGMYHRVAATSKLLWKSRIFAGR